MTGEVYDSYGEVFEFELHEMRNASEDTRRRWFEWWLDGRSFECLSCDTEFTPNVVTLEEGAEILCPRCMAEHIAKIHSAKG